MARSSRSCLLYLSILVPTATPRTLSIKRFHELALFFGSIASVILLTVGCDIKVGVDANSHEGKKSGFFGGGSSLAETVVGLLKSRLQAQAGISSDQAKVIASKSANRMESKVTALGLTQTQTETYLNNYQSFADEMVQGALEAFLDSSLATINRDGLNKVLSVVVGNTFLQMRGQIKDLSDPKFFQWLAYLTKSIVATLDDAGYPRQDLDEAVEIILQASLQNLKEANVLNESNAALVIGACIQGSVYALGDSGLSLVAKAFSESDDSDSGASDSSDTSNDNDEISDDEFDSYSPEKALDDFDKNASVEVDQENPKAQIAIAAILYKTLRSSFTVLAKMDFKADQLTSLAEHLMYATVSSMDDARFDKSTMIAVLDDAITGALVGISALPLKDQQFVSAIGNLVSGIVYAIDDLGSIDDRTKELIFEVTLFTSISRLSVVENITAKLYERGIKEIIAAACRALDDLGFSDADLVEYSKDIVLMALFGAMDLDDEANSDDDYTFMIADFIEEFSGVALGVFFEKGQEFRSSYFTALAADSDVQSLLGEEFDYDELATSLAKDVDVYFDFYGADPIDSFATPKPISAVWVDE